MLLVVHILIALSSIFYTAYLSFFPSRKKLTVTYTLVGATIATGTLLILSTPSHMLTTCITGLVYIGIVLVGITIANIRLAKVENE